MKKIFIIAIIALGIIFAGIIFFAPKKITLPTENKKRICPDQWYENKMPSIGEKRDADQYFVINGERKELLDFDIEWIKNNCAVNKPASIF